MWRIISANIWTSQLLISNGWQLLKDGRSITTRSRQTSLDILSPLLIIVYTLLLPLFYILLLPIISCIHVIHLSKFPTDKVSIQLAIMFKSSLVQAITSVFMNTWIIIWQKWESLCLLTNAGMTERRLKLCGGKQHENDHHCYHASICITWCSNDRWIRTLKYLHTALYLPPMREMAICQILEE